MKIENIDKVSNKFPSKFMSPICFWNNDERSPSNNGTLTLLKIKNRQIGVTCNHIIEFYEEKVKNGYNITTKIANKVINPTERIIDRDFKNDIVTLDLDKIDVDELRIHDEIGTQFWEPYNWPPKDLSLNDILVIGGFPGQFRISETNRTQMQTFTHGPFGAYSIDVNKITCQFRRENWQILKENDLNLPQIFGGISGGPAFVARNISGIIRFELIGINGQHNPFDIFYIYKVNRINENGKILLG